MVQHQPQSLFGTFGMPGRLGAMLPPGLIEVPRAFLDRPPLQKHRRQVLAEVSADVGTGQKKSGWIGPKEVSTFFQVDLSM